MDKADLVVLMDALRVRAPVVKPACRLLEMGPLRPFAPIVRQYAEDAAHGGLRTNA